MKRKWLIFAVIVIVGIIAVYFIFHKKTASVQTITVERGNISEEVSVTGNVKPVQSVDLAFEDAGRIAAVNVEVGDKVYAGEPLASLGKSELEAQLTKAEADLTTQNATLNKAKVDLDNYYASIPDILNDAYTKADDAVRTQLDPLFSNDESTNPTLTFSVSDVAISNDVRQLRLSVGNTLKQWRSELDTLNSAFSNDNAWRAAENVKNYLTAVRSLLLRASDAVGNAVNYVAISSSTATLYMIDINTGRANIDTALSNIVTQEQSITAQGAYIVSLEAGLASYKASIQNIEAQISKTTIYAPIPGTVTVVNAKKGEIAGANADMVSIISASKIDVEADVAEADIAKVKIGDPAEITLDAYGSDVVFDATVSFIDPGETMVEGVATYKTKFQFAKADGRPKSGMTANITIFTNKRDNVLVVPQRVVSVKDGISTVMLDLGEGRSEERTIQTGLKGIDGNVEVMQGLNEGDKVIVTNS